MAKSDSKGSRGGNQGKSGHAFDASHIKVPRNDTVAPTKFRDASHIKVPPKPASTAKPEK